MFINFKCNFFKNTSLVEKSQCDHNAYRVVNVFVNFKILF